MSAGCSYYAETGIRAYWINQDDYEAVYPECSSADFETIEITHHISIVGEWDNGKFILNLELSDQLEELISFDEGNVKPEPDDVSSFMDEDFHGFKGWNMKANKAIFNPPLDLARIYKKEIIELNKKVTLCKSSSGWTYDVFLPDTIKE